MLVVKTHRYRESGDVTCLICHLPLLHKIHHLPKELDPQYWIDLKKYKEKKKVKKVNQRKKNKKKEKK